MCIDLVPKMYAHSLGDGPSSRDLSFLSSDEIEHLLKRGHLTHMSPEQEFENFKNLASYILDKRIEFGKKRKKATISFILTYDCNLACSYCYQRSLQRKSNVPVMSEDFLNEFFQTYLPKIFPDVPKKNFIFLLFGGEPLLPANRSAITRILDYAKKHAIKVSTATNTMSFADMADLIGPKRGQIQNVQVTFDGDRLLHDQRRTPRSGQSTFDDMIDAVQQLIRLKAHIFIRIHTHPGKLDSIEKFVEYLEKMKILGHRDVDTYFAPINTFHSDSMSAMDLEIFRRTFQKVAALTRRPPSLNLDFLADILDMQSKNFLPKVRFCSLGNGNNFIVDPLGDIYDCYEEAGHLERRVGTLSDGMLHHFPLKETYATRHILNIPECLQCPVVLLCGGGCPTQARIQNGSLLSPYCLQNREYLAQTIKAYYFLNKGSATLSGA